MREILYPLAAMCLLSSCGSITLPAAVKMESGEALTGTTTAATSGGTFQVTSPTGNLNCSGNYDPFDTAPVIRGGSVCLNSFGLFVKWISASIMLPPSLVPAR